MNRRSFAAASVLLLVITLTGCGKKTDLVPPQKLVPVRITDLRAVLDENGATLEWSYPTEMENGDQLQAIESFEIYRSVMPAEDFCPGCPLRFEEPVVIEGGRLPASSDVKTAVDRERDLQSGYRYHYKVRARAGWWYASLDSNVVSFVWHTPPESPGDLQVETGDRTISLTWKPVEKNIMGNPLGQKPVYQVYRRSGGDDFISLEEPVQDTEFIDKNLVNENTYFYKVRALTVLEDSVQAGGFSRPVSGIPRDLTPPERPQNLLAVAVPEGVRLVWQAVDTGDLAGYRIYRRKHIAAAPELLAELAADRNQYLDLSVSGGGTWFYAVTAFDAQQPANESPPSEEAAVDLR